MCIIYAEYLNNAKPKISINESHPHTHTFQRFIEVPPCILRPRLVVTRGGEKEREILTERLCAESVSEKEAGIMFGMV